MTEDASNGSAKVTYSIKELLQDIRLSIQAVDTKLDSKADKADVAVISQRVDQHDTRLDGHDFLLGEVDKNAKAKVDNSRFRIPLVLSAVFNILSPFLWFAVNHLH